MSVFKYLSFGVGFLIFLSGCSIIKPQVDVVEKVPVSKNKSQDKDKKTLKKIKDCSKHKGIMEHASSYIDKEFQEGYLLKKDIVGAKAQLFLIQNKSSTIFAQNINAAQDSYILQYTLGQKKGCKFEKFKLTPLDKIKKLVKSLEKGK